MESLEQLKTAFETVVGITVTPFTQSNEIDEIAYKSIVAQVSAAGITALTPNGNTSEFYSLSFAERIRSVELTLEAARQDTLIIPGVGLDGATAATEAQLYKEMGAHAVMLHSPVHPFWSTEGWINSHRDLAASVPGMPVVPYIKSAKITPSVIQKLLDTVPEVIAIKYAVPDVVQFAESVSLIGQERVTWICGLAEMWAPFFAVAGATGFTSGLVSVDAPRSLRMLQALREGDYTSAMSEQREIESFEMLRARDDSQHNVTAVKEALEQLGLCSGAVRAPLSRLNAEDTETVSQILTSWGKR